MITILADNLKSLTKKLGIKPIQFLVFCLALIIILAGTIAAVQTIKQHYEIDVVNALETVMGATTEAVNIWSQNNLQIVQKTAQNKNIINAVEVLLKKQPKQTNTPSSPTLSKLHDHFNFLQETNLSRDYFIVGPGNVNITSSQKKLIGSINPLAHYPKLLEQLWLGETVIKRDNNLSDLYLLGAPIKNGTGRIIALLILYADLHSGLSAILHQGRLGKTGETYAFDNKGLMLSNSRFESDLQRLKLIAQDEHTAHNLYLYDPMTDLTVSAQRILSQNLTLSVTNAIQKQNGTDVSGYRDYRGVKVVGSWAWHELLNMGMVIEQDMSEAFNGYYLIEKLIYTVGLTSSLLLTILTLVFAYERRRIQIAEQYLAAIFENIIDAIIVIDEHGIIQKANLAVKNLFNYQPNELIGKNVSCLMPEPHQNQHDAYIKNYKDTGVAQIIGLGREVGAKRADNSVFPADLSICEFYLDSDRYFIGILRDISERKKIEEKFIIEQQFTKLIVDSLTSSIAVLDKTGKIIFVNEAWQSLVDRGDIKNDDMRLGTNYLDAIQHIIKESRKAQDITENLQNILDGKLEYFKLEYPYHSLNKERWFQMHAKCITHHDEQLIVISHINITERMQAEQHALKKMEEAEAANRAKSTFLATMSHEIRTPLNGIVGTIDALQYTSLNDNQEDLVQIAYDSSFILMEIIQDVLDFSKIEADRLDLELVPINLEEIMESLTETLRPIVEKKEIELLLYCDPSLPWLKADPVRLRQILYNLLGNAIKFTSSTQKRQGQITLSASIINSSTDHTDICFQIKDNGIGMTPEVQKLLFVPFVQGEESITRRFGGTGLGLTICKRLIEMMNGRIELHSKHGQGTTFSVYLTLDHISAPIQEEKIDLQALQILMIKGDAHTNQVVTHYLSHASAIVTICDADTVISQLSELHLPEKKVIIITDTFGKDTETNAYRELLQTEAEKIGLALYFILISRGKRRQARFYNENSISIDINAMHRHALIHAVGLLTGQVLPEQAGQKGNELLDSISDEEIPKCRVLLVDDNSTNRKVILYQLGVLGYSADTASNGKEALEMWHDNNEYGLILTDCHMPEMDGYELAQSIRSNATNAQPLIIAITADAVKGTADRCFKAGMNDYLTKPLKLEILRRKLRKWMQETASKEKNILEVTPPNEYKNEINTAIDSATLGNLLEIKDPALLADFYKEFLKSAIPTVDQLENAYKTGKLVQIGEMAHKLKSSARTVGANELADYCQTLESSGKSGDKETINNCMPHLSLHFKQVQQWIESYMNNIKDT